MYMYIHVLTRAYTYTNIFVYMYVYTSIYIYGVGLTRALASTTGVRTPRSWTWSRVNPMLGGWVNPHREQQTIPQGQTSSPRKSLFTPTAKARPDQAALVTSVEARGDTHRARPRSPSRIYTYRCLYICRNGRVPWQAPRKCARHAPGHGSGLILNPSIYIYIYIYIHLYTTSIYIYRVNPVAAPWIDIHKNRVVGGWVLRVVCPPAVSGWGSVWVGLTPR